jgi:2-polyprenyl-3-methyl-5-hydroxy-6-metoxy-1,4-benzoquinol methylase
MISCEKSIKLSRCLACDSSNIREVLNLGCQPLANSYCTSLSEDEHIFPLSTNLCHECYHIQLTHAINATMLFDKYLYVTGTSKTMHEYSQWFANFVSEYFQFENKTVLDIGCNDGTQLDYFTKLNWTTYGIDPAQNLYQISSLKHQIICDYFSSKITHLLPCNIDVIVAQNVFAHTSNPLDFLLACKEIMNDNTTIFIQTSQVNMVLNNEFDTIYHEHINFFNINSMLKLVGRAGLHLIDVLKTPVHGISYLFVIGKTKQNKYRIDNAWNLEYVDNLYSIETYKKWVDNIKNNTETLTNKLYEYANNNYYLIGYGAAAKGNTLLNFANYKLDFIIDENPLKQGLFTPGLKIPIVSLEKLQSFSQKDKILFVPLAWNFFDEIKAKIFQIRSNPLDKFIKFYPEVGVF